MKLVKNKGIVYLLDDKMDRLAKDLPIGTLCLCISVLYSHDFTLRKTCGEDHCYGCQPVVAVSKKFFDEKFVDMPELFIPTNLSLNMLNDGEFSEKDMELAFNLGKQSTYANIEFDNIMNIISVSKNIFECEVEWDNSKHVTVKKIMDYNYAQNVIFEC